MKIVEIIGDNLTSVKYNINTFIKRLLSHGITEDNLNLTVLEISSSTAEPAAKAGKIIIYVDSEGKINAKLPDNSIKTFATYTAP